MKPILTHEIVDPLWQAVVEQYISRGIDVSYMEYKLTDTPKNSSGDSVDTPPEEFCGCWTWTGTIFLNVEFGNLSSVRLEEGHEFDMALKLVIAHELAHELWNYLYGPQDREEILRAAREAGFETGYQRSLDSSSAQYEEELFCEYVSSRIAAIAA